MGLDSFWELPDTQPDIHFDPEINLCGGMFSGMGEGSFRGKVYELIVESITGESLYQKEIPNVTVRAMVDKFDSATFTEGNTWGIDEQEFNDLVRMFRAYANAGAVLKGWW